MSDTLEDQKGSVSIFITFYFAGDFIVYAGDFIVYAEKEEDADGIVTSLDTGQRLVLTWQS